MYLQSVSNITFCSPKSSVQDIAQNRVNVSTSGGLTKSLERVDFATMKLPRLLRVHIPAEK